MRNIGLQLELQFIVLDGTVVANVHKIHPDVFSNSRLLS